MYDGPLSFAEFEALLAPYEDMGAGNIAAAVSGGPDSMALVWLLSQKYNVTAITVDHALRDNSASEAVQVGEWLAGLDIPHHIITRDADRVSKSRVQETARHDRYHLMTTYCQAHHIKTLCVAHHQEDQAETFLFRLSKGSGLDGLSSMQVVSERDGIVLWRPLLDVSKMRLLATCEANKVPYVRDPSNEDDKYARVRLRQSMTVLSEEGLTAKRLSVTASRLSRARAALAHYADAFFKSDASKIETDRIYFSAADFEALPDEISLRCLLLAYKHIHAEDYGYGPRMEKLEDMHMRLLRDPAFNAATLGGCIVRRDHAKNVIIVELEQKNATLD